MTEENNGQPEEALPICFTIMPFREPFDTYWKTIYEPAIRAADMLPYRGDSIFRSGQIIDQIWELTQRAAIILAELTTLNANVFYELGLAHALGKPAVLVAEDIDNIPFDIHHQRRIPYDKNHPTWGTVLGNKITEALIATLEEPEKAVPNTFLQASEVQPENYDISYIEKQFLNLSNRLMRVEGSARIPNSGAALADIRTQEEKYFSKNNNNEFVKISAYDYHAMKTILGEFGMGSLMAAFNKNYPGYELETDDEIENLIIYLT